MRWRLVLAGVVCAAVARAAAAQPVGPAPLRPAEILRGSFEQIRRLTGFAAALHTLGHFLVVPGRGLIWQAESPFEVRTVITPSGLTQRIGEEETMRLTADRVPFLARMADMLTATLARDWQALERDFVIARSGDAAAWQVVLTPRVAPHASAMPFERIVVAGGRLVETVEMSRPGGDSDTVIFHDQTVSHLPLSDAEARILDGNGR